MNKTELKVALKSRGESIAGNIDVLRERLQDLIDGDYEDADEELDPSKMLFGEIKAALKARNTPTNGNKQV